MKQGSDNEDEDRPAEVQKFAGLFQAIVPSEVVIRPFQKLLSSKAKRTTKPSTTTKSTKKTKAPLEKLIVQKHWRRQSLVWSCPHNLEVLREKVQLLGPETVQWAVRYQGSAEPRHEEYDQDLHQKTMATNKAKDAFHEAANVLKRAFAHLESESAGSMLAPGVIKLMKIVAAPAQQVYWGSLLVLSLWLLAPLSLCLRLLTNQHKCDKFLNGCIHMDPFICHQLLDVFLERTDGLFTEWYRNRFKFQFHKLHKIREELQRCLQRFMWSTVLKLITKTKEFFES